MMTSKCARCCATRTEHEHPEISASCWQFERPAPWWMRALNKILWWCGR